MTALRVAIVDDEPLARVRLRRLLAQHADVEVCGDYESGPALIDAWPSLPADVLFVDIAMPALDGFELVARLAPRPRFVFVTAHADHAVRAFDIAASDYLVKPLSADRLAQTIARLRAADARPDDAATPSRFATRLALPLGRRSVLVPVDDIDCLVAQANYVEIHAGARRFVLRRTLASLHDALDPARFVRVHRSLVVRADAVTELKALASGRYRLKLAGGSVVDSGRRYREIVRTRFALAFVGD